MMRKWEKKVERVKKFRDIYVKIVNLFPSLLTEYEGEVKSQGDTVWIMDSIGGSIPVVLGTIQDIDSSEEKILKNILRAICQKHVTCFVLYLLEDKIVFGVNRK